MNDVVLYSCQEGDWVGVYKNGELVQEGHSMSNYDLESLCPIDSFVSREFTDEQEVGFHGLGTGRMPKLLITIERWK